jgi:hypothetical protein
MTLNGPWVVNVHYNITASGKKNQFQIIIIRLKRLGPGLDTRERAVVLLAGIAVGRRVLFALR